MRGVGRASEKVGVACKELESLPSCIPRDGYGRATVKLRMCEMVVSLHYNLISIQSFVAIV